MLDGCSRGFALMNKKGKNADCECTFLQSVGQELVQLCHLGRDAEVDGAVADLDDKAADDVGVNLYLQRKFSVLRKNIS